MNEQNVNFVDLFSLILHRRIAERLRQGQAGVLQIARNNLNRWLQNDDFAENKPLAWLEWQQILESRTSTAIAEIISQDTDKAQRLRSSSPFAGVLTEDEREQIWSECAKIAAI